MPKKLVPVLWSLVVLTSVLAGARDAVAQRAPEALTVKFDEYMEASVRANRFRGSVLVARDGRPIYSKAYGLANEELDVPNSARTVFRIGSLTKGFTAAAVMLLQERGKLRVADPICGYLHDCPAAWQPVTIKQLLSHTSGIKSYTELPDYAPKMPLAVSQQNLIGRIRDLPLEFAPGTQYKYSNSGYYLLGVIIERVSSQSYADFLQDHIFTPLGMTSTGYDSPRRLIKHRASGYSFQGGPLLNTLYLDMSIPFAAGALYSSVEDLLRWDQALYTETLLSRRSRDEMFTPAIQDRGYGWGIRTRFEHRVIEHDGGINGFASSLSRFTDDRVTVIVLSNNADVPTRDVANDLSAIVFGAPYTTPVTRTAITLDARTLERYAGQYRFAADAALSPNTIHTITTANGRLLRRVNELAIVELYPASATDFFLDVSSVGVHFEVNPEGRVTAMILRRNGREARGEKIR
jgi:D-alanyl-D-alanine carboxypeptidase